MHLFDDGYEALRQTDLRQPEAARGHSAEHEADPWPDSVLKPWDKLTPDRTEALHPAGRGLRRLRRLQRLRDRSGGPGVRGPRQARQHADHLHQRRQRHQRGRRPARDAQRGGLLQRRQHDAGGDADEVVRRVGHGRDLQPHVGRLVVGVRHAVRLVQAERLAPRRHQPEHGGHRGRRASRTRAGSASSWCTSSTWCRRCSRRPGIQRPGNGGRHQAGADRGHQLRRTPSTPPTPRCRPATAPSTSR